MTERSEEIISMMKEAGFYFGKDDEFMPEWERFAALVAAHERERMWCDAEFARQQEREACAKVCNEGVSAYVHSDYTKGLAHGAKLCAAAIRARGEK